MHDKFKRSFKYIIIALVVYLSCQTIPKEKIPPSEALMLAMMASVTFAILDMYAPCVASPS